MKEFQPDKFIVINTKRFEELRGNSNGLTIKIFKEALRDFNESYRHHMRKPMDQKYYVCNQDEPYAEQVLDLILGRNKREEYPGVQQGMVGWICPICGAGNSPFNNRCGCKPYRIT